MLDLVQENAQILGVLAAVGAAYYAYRISHVSVPTGDQVQMTVFCGHCNWEGRVRRNGGRCGGCGSRDLRVLAV